MKVLRKVIEIDETRCNGCGACVGKCAEGAIELVNGKAKLISDAYCDGLGACIGECPAGAIRIVEREAERFDEAAVKAKAKNRPKDISSPDVRARGHACPGSMVRAGQPVRPPAASMKGCPEQAIPSELSQWPVQLHLVRPEMPFFKRPELVVLSTCSPVASADIHWRFLRGRAVVVACPKLDRLDGYVEKLTAILREEAIKKVIVVRMEVPCCGGLTAIVRKAAADTGREALEVEEVFVGLAGNISKSG